MNENDPPYELRAVPPTDAGSPLRVIGRYQTYEEASWARDEDVLDQLAVLGGWYALIEHVIVGPGLQGPRTVHRHATALGWTQRPTGFPMPMT